MSSSPNMSPKAEAEPVRRWNSLEITKLIVSALTPALILGLSIFFSYQRDTDAKREVQHRRAADRRIDVWVKVMPEIDQLYSYFLYVGRWKELGPQEIIQLKRQVDDSMYSNRILFDPHFFKAYERMMNEMFRSFQGWGKDAALRTVKIRPRDAESGAYIFTNEDNRSCIHQAFWNVQIKAANELDILVDEPGIPKIDGAMPAAPGLPAPTVPTNCIE